MPTFIGNDFYIHYDWKRFTVHTISNADTIKSQFQTWKYSESLFFVTGACLLLISYHPRIELETVAC